MSWSCCMLIAEEETESAGIIERFGRNRSISRNLTHGACVFIRCRRNVPQIWTILNFEFLDEMKSCTFVFTSVRHFVKCHANHVKKERVFLLLESHQHVCKQFTRQIRVYQQEKVGERVGENRGKFYLSPTRVCQL